MTRPNAAAFAASLPRLAETVRHLRWRQVAARGRSALFGRLVGWIAAQVPPAPRRRAWIRPLGVHCFLEPRQAEPGVFKAVGEVGRVSYQADWDTSGRSALWLFTLHYLDDLALPEDPFPGAREALFDRWISENPPCHGVGWHPYPTSLRLVNAVKWCCRQAVIPDRWLASIGQQARALDWRVEDHIGANHVFANAKGLVFAGAFLDGPFADALLARGLRRLNVEVAEQFLADGGHYERSPMYHALLLWDLLDLIDLAGASGLEQLQRRAKDWSHVATRGLDWLAAMTHPDGLPAFFNDAAFAVAPTLAQLRQYAGSLGLPPSVRSKDSWPIVTHLADSGYVIVEAADLTKAILDVAPIEPGHQPGHAHADTLSFELSLRGHRLIVNSGTSTYAVNAERHRQRSTAAHSTVEVDGENSSDVWRSFRVGRRARPFGLGIDQTGERVIVRAAHDGYRRLSGSPVHSREWQFTPGRLHVFDTVSGGAHDAVARYHLHPAVRVINGGALRMPDGGIVHVRVTAGSAHAVPSTWHPEFGGALPNVCLEVPVPPGGQCVEFAWGSP